jgi:hypothetical protein
MLNPEQFRCLVNTCCRFISNFNGCAAAAAGCGGCGGCGGDADDPTNLTFFKINCHSLPTLKKNTAKKHHFMIKRAGHHSNFCKLFLQKI